MTNEEAKFLLNSYRANGSDANDPTFAEALKQAQVDPALAGWFAREQAHSAAIAAKLAEMKPPAGLREKIIAGGQASVARERGMPRAAWWWAIAAAVAVVASVVTFNSRSEAADTASLTALAMADAVEATEHGGHGTALAELQTAMQNPTARLSQALPVKFAELQKTGCRTLSLQGRPVLEVCFQRGGKWFHCYIGRRADFVNTGADVAPRFASQGGVSAATWSAGDYLVSVAGIGEESSIRELL